MKRVKAWFLIIVVVLIALAFLGVFGQSNSREEDASAADPVAAVTSQTDAVPETPHVLKTGEEVPEDLNEENEFSYVVEQPEEGAPGMVVTEEFVIELEEGQESGGF